MVYFGKSDRMIKISGKVDKPKLTKDSVILIFRPLSNKKFEELWYNETVCLWMTGVEHSAEGINGCHSRNAKLFWRTEHSGIR